MYNKNILTFLKKLYIFYTKNRIIKIIQYIILNIYYI